MKIIPKLSSNTHHICSSELYYPKICETYSYLLSMFQKIFFHDSKAITNGKMEWA